MFATASMHQTILLFRSMKASWMNSRTAYIAIKSLVVTSLKQRPTILSAINLWQALN